MYHKRTSEDIMKMARIFDEYHTCFRSFVSENPGHIKASLDRGTIAYPPDMYEEDELNMLGSKRNNRSFSYGPEEGDIKVREEIVKVENLKHGTNYSSDNVAIMPGAWGGLEFALQEVLNFRKGKSEGKVAVIGPTLYQMFYTPIEHFGMDVEAYDFTKSDNNHRPESVDELTDIFDNNPKAIVVTNSNNPDGVYFNPNVLKQIVEKARERGIYVLIDEIQNCFPSKGKGLDYDSWIQSSNVIRLDSPSKRYALSDCRVGWMIAEPEILYGHINGEVNVNRVEGVVGRMSGVMGNAPRIANNLLIHILKNERKCLSNGEHPFAEYSEQLRAKRDFVIDQLRSMPKVEAIHTPESCVNVTARIDSSKSDLELSQELMKRGLLLMPASGYGYNPEDSTLRITFAERKQKIEEGMNILREYLLDKK